MKNVVFWDLTPCGSCNSRRFGGTYHLHHQGDKNSRARNSVSSNQQSKFADSCRPSDVGDVTPKRRFLQEAHGVFFRIASIHIFNASH
jgi:hypothetical protein